MPHFVGAYNNRCVFIFTLTKCCDFQFKFFIKKKTTTSISIVDSLVEPSDVLYIATTIAQKGYNIKQCTIQIEKYRENECDDAASITNSKSHSIVSENDTSIINILT